MARGRFFLSSSSSVTFPSRPRVDVCGPAGRACALAHWSCACLRAGHGGFLAWPWLAVGWAGLRVKPLSPRKKKCAAPCPTAHLASSPAEKERSNPRTGYARSPTTSQTRTPRTPRLYKALGGDRAPAHALSPCLLAPRRAFRELRSTP